MGGEHHWELTPDRTELAHHRGQQRTVYERRPVQCDEQVLPRANPMAGRSLYLTEARFHRDQAVDHRIAHEMDPICRDALRLEVEAGLIRVDEQEVAELV